MDLPFNLLTFGGASTLALLITQMVKYALPKNARVPSLTCIGIAVVLLLVYAWFKGMHGPAELVEVAVMGLFAGTTAVGMFEAQKILPVRLPSRTPEGPALSPPMAIPVEPQPSNAVT
jgi:hypothetical protein